MISDEPLTQEELSHRWKVPIGTLSQWRYNGKGPTFLKLGKHISYRIKDVEEFEEKNRGKTLVKQRTTMSKGLKLKKDKRNVLRKLI